jgi:hypothetical protein
MLEEARVEREREGRLGGVPISTLAKPRSGASGASGTSGAS